MQTHPASALADQTVIGELAKTTGCSYEEARAAYEAECVRLETAATVTTFIPVIARRRAREALVHARH
jgi:hypothetical protein